jgi:hypothetical protein
MPDETGSQNPTPDAGDHTQTNANRIETPSEQQCLRDKSKKDADNQVSDVTREMKREFRLVEGVTIATNVILAVVGIFALKAYYGQLGAMQGQLGQMQAASSQTDRLLCLTAQQLTQMGQQSIAIRGFASAAVYQAMTATEAEGARFTFTRGAPFINAGQTVSVPIELVNTGNTAARDVFMEMGAVFSPRDKDPPFSYRSQWTLSFRAKTWSSGNGNGSSSVMPGGFHVTVRDMAGNALIGDSTVQERYVSGQNDIVVYGKVTFTDMYGVKHWERVCQAFAMYKPGFLQSSHHEKCTRYAEEDSNRVMEKPAPTTGIRLAIPEIPCPKSTPE